VNVLETSGLGKRYGRTWALRECTLAIPAGHLAALVGPNGAGKSTRIQLSVGLAVPTAGVATVLGGRPAGSPAALERAADYLVVLSGGQLRAAGEVDDLLARHRVLTGPAAEAGRYARQLPVVQARCAAAQAHLLVAASGPAEPVPPGWEAHPVGLEELVLAYLRAPGRPGPSLVPDGEAAQASR
jgi:ABC-type molybdenum transport system ATPase subunit/photorepair protein PhrA